MSENPVSLGVKDGVSFWQKMREVIELLSPDATRLFMLVQCSSPDSMLLAEKDPDDRDLTFAVILDLIPDGDEPKAIQRVRDLKGEIRAAIESWNITRKAVR